MGKNQGNVLAAAGGTTRCESKENETVKFNHEVLVLPPVQYRYRYRTFGTRRKMQNVVSCAALTHVGAVPVINPFVACT